jgi:Uma2 family endonuclease
MITTELSLFEQLDRAEGKAEIINGAVVILPMSGRKPTRAAEEIHASLRQYVRRVRKGEACADGNDYTVDLPHRQSFRPDASYFVGPDPGMKFFDGAPQFAVEVRSENDYGRTAEREMAAKRADYFAAGTLAVWDVDLLGEEVVRVFRDGDADQPAAVFRRGDTADAEPAVPGWTMPVDDLFAPGT